MPSCRPDAIDPAVQPAGSCHGIRCQEEPVTAFFHFSPERAPVRGEIQVNTLPRASGCGITSKGENPLRERRKRANGHTVTEIVKMFLVALVLLAPVAGLPCSFISTPHELDPLEQKIDITPPERVSADLLRISRGHGPKVHENGTMSASSCDDIGMVVLKFRAAPKDDRTQPGRLGYLVVLTGGKLPEGFSLSDTANRDLDGNNEYLLHWLDGASDEQEALEFAVSIVVVDLAGNRSVPSEPIWVRHPGRKVKK